MIVHGVCATPGLTDAGAAVVEEAEEAEEVPPPPPQQRADGDATWATVFDREYRRVY